MSPVTAQGLARQEEADQQIDQAAERIIQEMDGEVGIRALISSLDPEFREETVREAVWQLLDTHRIELTEDRSLRLPS